VEDSGFDGWADLGAQRQDEDEALVQRYAASEGRGQDMRPVRGFVAHVRRDIGSKGVICRVRMTEQARGQKICVWFYFPQDGQTAAAPQTATSTDVRPLSTGSPATGIAALAQASTAPPASPARSRPAPGAAAASST
jgi:hypothetical protein